MQNNEKYIVIKFGTPEYDALFGPPVEWNHLPPLYLLRQLNEPIYKPMSIPAAD